MSSGGSRDFEPFTARIVDSGKRPPALIIDKSTRGGTFKAPRDRSVSFDGVTLEGVDLSGSRFDHAMIKGSTFLDCDFRGVKFEHVVGFDAEWPSAFVGCKFDRADLRNLSDPSTSRFEGCTFRQAKIFGWNSWCGEFVDCLFEGRLESVLFAGRPTKCYEIIDSARATAIELGIDVPDVTPPPRRASNEFRGNDFSSADLVNVEFRYGVDIAAQRWPEGPDYLRFDRWRVRLARTRSVVETWPVSKEQADALALLALYDGGGWEEQSEVFLPRDALSYCGRDLREKLVTLLRAD
jgi:uncharacterized protein YjbI with pentapeptide repeats